MSNKQVNLTVNIKCPIPEDNTAYPAEEFEGNLIDQLQIDLVETIKAQYDVKAIVTITTQ